MELGEWIGGRIIENLDNRGSDNRGSTVLHTICVTVKLSINPYSSLYCGSHLTF